MAGQSDDLALVAKQLLRMETELLQPGFRADRDALAAYLAKEFCEFGSSGRIYSRQDAIDALTAESPAQYAIADFSAALPAKGVALVKYRAERRNRAGEIEAESLRSSVWVLRAGRWQMLFHQGTRREEERLHERETLEAPDN